MDKADDVILVLVADRIARLLLLDDGLDAVGGWIIEIEADHIRARHHDLTCVQLGKGKDLVNEVRLRAVDEPLTEALLHQETDLLLRVCVLVFALDLIAEFAADVVCHRVEHPDKGAHDASKEHHGERDREEDALHVGNRHRLRRQLAEHDVERGDEGKGNRERNRVPDLVRQPHVLRRGQNQHGNRRLAHPAEAERGERDAELCHGQRGVEVIGQLLGVFRTADALGDQRLKARRADLDAAEFRRDEEAVHKDQKDDEQ